MKRLFPKISPIKTNSQKNQQTERGIGKATKSQESLHKDLNNGDNQSEASYGSTSSNPSPCGQCKKLAKEEDPAMKCEICDQWYHIKCQNITKADYNYIQGGMRKKSLSQMYWYCQTCNKMESTS